RTRFSRDWSSDVCSSDLSFEQTFSHPQVVHGQMVATVDSPVGPLKLLAPAFQLSRTPATVRTTPPLHGQHTEEVLRWLGYTTERSEERRVGKRGRSRWWQ